MAYAAGLHPSYLYNGLVSADEVRAKEAKEASERKQKAEAEAEAKHQQQLLLLGAKRYAA